MTLGFLCATGLQGSGDPADHPGVGAIPYTIPGGGFGTTFRTWAPHADAVSVVGSVNLWNPSVNPLSAEEDGYWSTDIMWWPTGTEYKFVIQDGADSLWKNDPRARLLTHSAGTSIVYDPDGYQWQGDGYTTPPWNEMVIYEMHVGTFFVADGTPVPSGFSAAIEKLDYLRALGINVIELMPVWEFPGEISWGYNGSYPFSIETGYGGPDDLKAFVDAAHDRGIAVFLDVIYNHFGPTDMDMWRYDGWFENDLGGLYFYNDEDRAYTPWGNTRPDYGREGVRTYIRDNVMQWLHEFQIDGLRIDGVQWIRRWGDPPWENGGDLPEGWSLLQLMNDEVDASQPWKLIIAEDGANEEWITKSTGEGGAGFDSQYCIDFSHLIRGNLEAVLDEDRDMGMVASAIGLTYNGWHLQRVIFTENHDEVANGQQRLPEEIWPGNAGSWHSRKRSTLGAALVMTSPGIPMIFQGQEFLEDGWFTDTDPLDWSKLDTYSGIHLLYRDLISLRRNLHGNTRGLTGPSLNIFHVNNDNKVIAFHRWQDGGAGDDVVIVTNFSATYHTAYRIGLPRQGTWEIIFNSDAQEYSSDYGGLPGDDTWGEEIAWDGMPFSGIISIPPYTCCIYSQVDTPPSNPHDLDGDLVVGFNDLLILLNGWGMPGPADFNGTGAVDFSDLVALLGNWGPVPP